MRALFLIHIILVTLLISCSSEERQREKKIEIKQNAFVLNLQHCFTDAENELSFPIWFNDSVIRSKKIKSVIRSVSRKSEDENDEVNEIRKYSFNKDGHIIELIIEEYYDDRLVGNLKVEYRHDPDEWGYSEEKIIHHKGVELTKSNFRSYEKEEYSEKYLVYRNIYTNDYLFYLKDKSFWGVLSVDSILNPTPKDFVVYGVPTNPVKKFQINNKVNESNVTEFNYHPTYGFVTKLGFDNYPFRYKRSFVYNQQGDFDYYVDSTFSEGVYLNKSISSVELDSDFLPAHVAHEHYVEGNEVGYVENENFEYEFYTE